MRARRLCQSLAWITVCLVAPIFTLVLVAADFTASAAAADSLPEPICWRQLAFSIPFKVAQVQSPEQQPTEVRLYVSANQGVQWEIVQRVSPTEHSFTFRAPHDGEYWFQIRTADRQGQVAPEVGSKPELRVIVDTMPPRLDLTAARGEAGEVKASWQAVDPLLNADSLKIEYQTSAGSWRAVAVDRPPGGQNHSTTTGTLTWFPNDAPAGSVAVRAEISDQAGNVTVSQAQANLAGVAPRRDSIAGNAATKPADADRNWISTPSPGWATAGPAPMPNSAPSSAQQSSTPPNSASYKLPSGNSAAMPWPPMNSASASPQPSKQLAGDPGATPWPTDRSADQPLGRNPIPSDDVSNQPAYASSNSHYATSQSPYVASQSPFGAGQPSYSTDNQSPYAAGKRYGNDQSPYVADQPSYVASQSQSPSSQSRYTDVASRAEETVNPPIRNQMLDGGYPSRNDAPPTTNFANNNQPTSPPLSIPSPPTSPSTAASGQSAMSGNFSSSGMLPPGERPRMVNSKSFDLDYEVDGIGPSGIAKVELWGTRDGGRNWSSYGVDDNNRSPIRANVEGEGLYGFRIVVQSGNGLGGLPPHSGDAPDLWVMVDLTKPNVHLIDATAGDGPHSGELLVHWEASDAALAARPITLLFSDRPGGPWSIIAAGLENTGQYAWRPDSRVPDRIYLRIEARDEAGNTGVFEAAQPVALDRIRPEGRIRGVHPTGEAAIRSRSAADIATGPQVYDFSR
jgi:hypothetical protein